VTDAPPAGGKGEGEGEGEYEGEPVRVIFESLAAAARGAVEPLTANSTALLTSPLLSGRLSSGIDSE
jgi:hypothetical protein